MNSDGTQVLISISNPFFSHGYAGHRKGQERMVHTPSWTGDGSIMRSKVLIGQFRSGHTNRRRLIDQKRLATDCCILPFNLLPSRSP